MPQTVLDSLGKAPALVHSVNLSGLADPVVTFCCPTFGRFPRRAWMLNEVVYWYMRQTYPYRELLILNDSPAQYLYCSNLLIASGVRIINFPYRIRTLGEKRNLAVLQAAGSVIIPQDDDDISLPWRAEQSVKALVKADYWSPGLWWYYEQGKGTIIPDAAGVGHNCSAYRRSSFMNRYPSRSGDEDRLVVKWAREEPWVRVNDETLYDPKDINYVYRWGVSDHHISAFGPTGMQEAYDSFDPGPPGDFEIKSEMGADWVKVHEEAVARACDD